MRLSRTNFFYRLAYFGAQYPPRRETNVCAVFWRCVLKGGFGATLLGLLGYGLYEAAIHWNWSAVWLVLVTIAVTLFGLALIFLLAVGFVWFFTEHLPKSETVNLIATRIADYKERKCTKVELY